MVLVAVALLATSVPALDDARTTATVDRLETEGERLDRAVASLAADSVAVDDPTLAARTTMTLRAPTGITAARIDRLVLGDPERIIGSERTDSPPEEPPLGDSPRTNPERTTTEDSAQSSDRFPTDVALVYWLPDGPPRTVPLTSSSVASVRVIDGPIELRTSGPTRIELRFVDERGVGTVRAARVR